MSASTNIRYKRSGAPNLANYYYEQKSLYEQLKEDKQMIPAYKADMVSTQVKNEVVFEGTRAFDDKPTFDYPASLPPLYYQKPVVRKTLL